MNEEQLRKQIHNLLAEHGMDGKDYSHLLKEFILNSLLYYYEEPTPEVLITLLEGLDEIRKSLKMFKISKYDLKISIFGSARTPIDHPLYNLAFDFAEKAASYGYKIITGAGPGIMEAGNKGAKPENSFGLGLKLPYENENPIFKNHLERLTIFNHFYSRKMTFYRESQAIVVLPGGFGTMDEVFQGLTTMQTGKKMITPFILLDIPGGNFWKEFDEWIIRNMDNRYISKVDRSLYSIVYSVSEALQEINSFYSILHSYFELNGFLFIQLKKELTPNQNELVTVYLQQIGLEEFMFIRKRYYLNSDLYIYRTSIEKIRDYVNIKKLISFINTLK